MQRKKLLLDEALKSTLELILKSIERGKFVKISLGNPRNKNENLRALLFKGITIKNEIKYSCTYRFATRDEVKNYDANEMIKLVELHLKNSFDILTLFETEEETIIEKLLNQTWRIRMVNASHSTEQNLRHNNQKNVSIESVIKPYLVKLGISNPDGIILKNAQDKFRQINHYIEILKPLFEQLPNKQLRIVDMGSGKGYLTFALFDYLQAKKQYTVSITGIEQRKNLVDLCNQISIESNFEQLNFIAGSIDSYHENNFNILIALHACDTATDDAIAKAIEQNAQLIVVAPCCHKQIRKEMEKSNVENEMKPLLKHGIFMERQAEMITDTLRALYLELYDYKTKVFEFVSDIHTPKNIMITAEKRTHNFQSKKVIKTQIDNLKKKFGIGEHHLEKILKL